MTKPKSKFKSLDAENGVVEKRLIAANVEPVLPIVEATPTINPLHINSSGVVASQRIIRDDDDDSGFGGNDDISSDKNRSNSTTGWLFGLRIAYCIFALICLVEGIQAYLLNSASGEGPSGISVYAGFGGCFAALWFTFARRLRYVGYFGMTVVMVIFGVLAMAGAAVSYASFGTLIACMGGNNDFYGDSSYYQDTLQCFSQDSLAFEDCNCVNTVDNNCIVNPGASDHCQAMLDDSPGLAYDVYIYAILQLVFSLILSFTYCFAITEEDVDWAWFVWNGGGNNKPYYRHDGNSDVNIDVLAYNTDNPLHFNSNYGETHHHYSHTGSGRNDAGFIHHGGVHHHHHHHGGGFHHGGVGIHHLGGHALSGLCACLCNC